MSDEINESIEDQLDDDEITNLEAGFMKGEEDAEEYPEQEEDEE